jgi:tubulin polyglutamylase TTLL4
MKGAKSKYCHLTNFSVNKKSEKFVKPTATGEEDGVFGNKWSFTGLRKKYKEMGVDSEAVFKGIYDVIIKTLISCEQPI